MLLVTGRVICYETDGNDEVVPPKSFDMEIVNNTCWLDK